MSLMVPLEEMPHKNKMAKLETDEGGTAKLAKPKESLLNEISQLRLPQEPLKESEGRYGRLLELCPDAIVIHGESRIIYVNPAGLKLFGAESPSQIIGKSLLDLVPLGYREMARSYLLEKGVLEKGVEFIILQEQKLMKCDGRAIDVEIVGMPITYLHEPAIQMIIKDISERIKAEDTLRESEQRLANIIDFHPDATLVIDREGKIIAWNLAMEEMTGVKAENMLGKVNYEYSIPFYGERRPILIDLVFQPEEEITKFAKVKREGPCLTAETYLPSFRGREAFLYERANILRDLQGNTIGAVETIQDITDRLRAEAERFRSDKVESLGPLAGGIAHDFSNILTAIQRDIGLVMNDEKLKRKLRDKLAQAEKACLGAQDLWQQLLTFAQVGAPTKKLVSIATLLKESAVVTLSGAKSSCELSFANDLWPVEADESQINRAISNFLTNADQAMPEGGMIKISAENVLAEEEQDLPISEGKYVRVTFADEGGGIPPEYLQNIFDPYFSSQGKGKGLGLASAYAIIKKHAGYIKVESRVGVGTAFHIYLPAMETGAPAADPENRKTQREHS
jgi:PAS domain S-box-containing protein